MPVLWLCTDWSSAPNPVFYALLPKAWAGTLHITFQMPLPAASDETVTRRHWKENGRQRVWTRAFTLFAVLICVLQQWQFILAAAIGSRHQQLSTLTESISEILTTAQCACSSQVWNPILWGPWTIILCHVNLLFPPAFLQLFYLGDLHVMIFVNLPISMYSVLSVKPIV